MTCHSMRLGIAKLLQHHTITGMGYSLRHMTCHDMKRGRAELLQYHTVSDSGIQFATYDLS